MTRTPEEIRNFEASVRQRLFNLSKEQGRDFQSVLKIYFLSSPVPDRRRARSPGRPKTSTLRR